MILDPSIPQTKPLDIDDRIGPIPPEKTCILYGSELPIYFVKEQRQCVITGSNIIAGRDRSHCQLVLSSAATARIHARFVLRDNTWFLSDSKSTNGVFLNGCRLKCGLEYHLCPNDEIVFGDEKVIFDHHERRVPAPQPIPVRPTPPVTPPLPTPYPAILPEYSIHRLSGLILCHRNNWGVRTLFDDTDPLILHDPAGEKLLLHYGDIDLSGGVAVFPDKTSCPKQHALFFYNLRNNAWTLMDCGTLEGTRINGDPLEPLKKYPLQPGDLIQFGGNAQYSFGDHTLGNQYRIVQLLEKSAFTKTYLAEHQKNKNLYIAKVMDKTAPGYTSAIGDLFLDTAKLTIPLRHHMIPRTIDLIEDPRHIMAVREYVPGDDLLKVLEKNGPFSADLVIDVGIRLCNVLGYLHSLNPARIHRDIKPSNIILQPDGRLALIDFEIMICCHPDELESAPLLGTRGYAAPEQYQTARLTPAADIYVLGVTLHQLVTGKDPACPPYEYRPIRQIDPSLPKNLEQIIQKCTHPDPQKRYQTCAALQADLEKAKTAKSSFLDRFRR